MGAAKNKKSAKNASNKHSANTTPAKNGDAKNGHHHGHGEWKWLGDGTLRAEDPDEGLGHIVELSIFNKVFAALLVLTVITVAASRVDFGSLNTVIAIIIASVKALLVALFFMHLKFEKKLIILYALYPLVLLFLLIGGSLMDVTERHTVLPSWKPKADLLAKPAPGEHHESGHGSAAPHTGETHQGQTSKGGQH